MSQGSKHNRREESYRESDRATFRERQRGSDTERQTDREKELQ